jgi:hypothetical protein
VSCLQALIQCVPGDELDPRLPRIQENCALLKRWQRSAFPDLRSAAARCIAVIMSDFVVEPPFKDLPLPSAVASPEDDDREWTVGVVVSAAVTTAVTTAVTEHACPLLCGVQSSDGLVLESHVSALEALELVAVEWCVF